MYVSQKIEIKPNKEQQSILIQGFHYSRYIYNKALSKWNEMYEEYIDLGDLKLKPNQYKLAKWLRDSREKWEFNQLNILLETSLMNLNEAFNNYKKGLKNLPKFHSKKNMKYTCRFYKKNEWSLKIKDKVYLCLQGMKDSPIRMKEKVRYDNYDIKEVTISKKGNKWFASICFLISDNDSHYKSQFKPNTYCGIDLGIRKYATINDSYKKIRQYDSFVKSLDKYYDKCDYYNHVLSRKYNTYKRRYPNDRFIPSKAYNKVKTKLNNVYRRINNITTDYLHKLTSKIVNKYEYITIEDMMIKEMISKKKKDKNKRLVKSY